jgi:hypothetical protein
MKVRRLKSDELPAVMRFYRKYHGDRERLCDEKSWLWQFSGNPAVDKDKLPFFVIEDKGEIKGTIGATPLLLHVGDELLSACHPVSFFVAPGYKGLPALQLRAKMVADYDVIIAANISSDTDRLSRASAYVDFSEKFHSYTLTTGLARERTDTGLATLARSALIFASRLAWLGLLKVYARFVAGSYEIRISQKIDSGISGQGAADGGVFFIDKSTDYLRWRYERSPLLDCRFVSIRSSATHGITAVVKTDDVERCTVILDFLGRIEDRSLLRLLILEIIDSCRKEGMRFVSTAVLDTAIEGSLTQATFRCDKSALGFMINAKDRQLKSRLSDSGKWRFLIGDTDFY